MALELTEKKYELDSELAQSLMLAADSDPTRKLAWVNSVCILILLIGIFGSKPASIEVRRLPPIEEISSAIVEPLPPPPQTQAEHQPREQNNQQAADTPQVVIVTPESPTINFAVPTIGNLVVPHSIAQAPPIAPMKRVEPLRTQPTVLNTTGSSGDRPQPPYPKIALEQGQQGSVTLRMTVDEAGLIQTVEVAQSSGFPILDRGAMDFVKRHWTVHAEKGTRAYEATINYQLQHQ